MKKIAVLLAGCGFKDGAEITEAISTLIALGEHNVEYRCFSLNKDFSAVNHINDDSQDTRNVMIESSRITRGVIESIENLDPKSYDAIVFPGGFGVAQHFCEFAALGAKAGVNPKIKSLYVKMNKSGRIGCFR